jgi:hypothetical protein
MTPDQIRDALSAPFQPHEVKFKPQSVKGNRALAMAYTDCRVIQDRLDSVVGVESWQDEYEILADGSVMCRLKLRLHGEWVVKADVGSPSEQPDGGDRMKAAFSDALKRAAVKFGVGRYLYRLPAVWCDYDPQKKQFSVTPQLPAWAVPKKNGPPPAPPPACERPTDAEIRDLLTRKGWGWKECVQAINTAGMTDYPTSTLPKDLPAEVLADFCGWLEQEPSRPAKQPA